MAAAQLPAFLFVLFSVLPGSGGERNITAEPGKKVVLPCRAEGNKSVSVVEWIRPDLGEHDHVFLYRNEKFDPEGHHPDYKNRVDLQDKQMKDGNVSLVLNNVTSNDAGKYECRVDYKNNRSKRSNLDTVPISIVYLDVSPGNKEGQKDNGGKETMNEENGGNNKGRIFGLPVFPAIVVLIVGGGLLYKKKKTFITETEPEAELKPMKSSNQTEPEVEPKVDQNQAEA